MMSTLGPALDAELAYRRERLADAVAPAGNGHPWLSSVGRRVGSLGRTTTHRPAARPSRPA